MGMSGVPGIIMADRGSDGDTQVEASREVDVLPWSPKKYQKCSLGRV